MRLDRLRVQILLFVLLCASVLGFGSGKPAGTAGGDTQDDKWISYLTNVFSMFQAEGGCGSSGCEWRLYQPTADEDILLLALPAIPRNVFWDSRFEKVYNRIGRDFYSVPWKRSTKPEKLLTLPATVPISWYNIADIWIDLETRNWRIKTSEWVKVHSLDRVWEYSSRDSRWSMLTERTNTCDTEGCPDPVAEFINPQERVRLVSLLLSMGVKHHLTEKQLAAGVDNKRVYFPSRAAANRGIITRMFLGDTFHAMAPLMYVNQENDQEKLIYEKNEECYGFLSFQEQGHLLLVGSEYRGRCARLVDMRTGEIVRRFPRNSFSAVWVPAFRE